MTARRRITLWHHADRVTARVLFWQSTGGLQDVASCGYSEGCANPEDEALRALHFALTGDPPSEGVAFVMPAFAPGEARRALEALGYDLVTMTAQHEAALQTAGMVVSDEPAQTLVVIHDANVCLSVIRRVLDVLSLQTARWSTWVVWPLPGQLDLDLIIDLADEVLVVEAQGAFVGSDVRLAVDAALERRAVFVMRDATLARVSSVASIDGESDRYALNIAPEQTP